MSIRSPSPGGRSCWSVAGMASRCSTTCAGTVACCSAMNQVLRRGSVAGITAGPTDWMARCRRPRIGTATPRGRAGWRRHRDELHLEVVRECCRAGMVFVHLGGRSSNRSSRRRRHCRTAGKHWTSVVSPHVETRRIRHRRELEAVVENFLDYYHLHVRPSASRIRRCRSRRGRSRSRRADRSRRYVPCVGRPARRRRPAVRCRRSAMYRSRCRPATRTSSVSSRTRSCSSRPTGSRSIGFEPIAPDHTIEHMAHVRRSRCDRRGVRERPIVARRCHLRRQRTRDVPVLARLQRRAPIRRFWTRRSSWPIGIRSAHCSSRWQPNAITPN